MLTPTHLTIGGIAVHARGRLDLLETRLVHIAGSLDPTPHGSTVAEHAALAVVERSTSCLLLHDGPGIASAALDALMLAAPDRAVVVARRGVTEWHESLAARGALILDGAAAPLLSLLADATLIIEQAHAGLPPLPPSRRRAGADPHPCYRRIQRSPIEPRARDRPRSRALGSPPRLHRTAASALCHEGTQPSP